jgi:predicted transcriptional regulator
MSQRDHKALAEDKNEKHRPLEIGEKEFLDRACDIIVAFLNKNSVAPEDVPGLITSVHATLLRLFAAPAQGGRKAATGRSAIKTAPNVRNTVTPDYIICLEDGKRLQTLKRYIGGRYGLTPEQYREKWNLPEDYPMVAPNYAKRRSQIAKQMGLGRTQKKKRDKRR